MRNINQTTNTATNLDYSDLEFSYFQSFYAQNNKVPTEFINDLLVKEALFKGFIACLENPNDFRFKLRFPNGQELLIDKFTVLKDLYTTNHTKLDMIHSIVSKESMIRTFSNEKVPLKIANQIVSIPASQVINTLLTGAPIPTITSDNHYDIEAIKWFLSRHPIDLKYDLPDECLERIKLFQLIDLNAIDKINTTKDMRRQSISLDPTLIEEVLSEVPEDFDTTEKAIHVYIKLCDLLAFDPEYITDYKENYKNNSNPANISKITLGDNQVVCYTFNAIYGKFLSILGINYETIVRSKVGDSEVPQFFVESDYIAANPKLKAKKPIFERFKALLTRKKGKELEEVPLFVPTHAFLDFKSDGFLVRADSVQELYTNDLSNVKIGEDINGIESLSTDPNIRQVFNEKVDKVYNHYKKTKKNKSQELVSPDVSFEEAHEIYRNLFSSNPNVPLNQKKDILLNTLQNCNLPTMEATAYLHHLFFKVLFCNQLAEQAKVSFEVYRQKEKQTAATPFTKSIAVAIIFHNEEETVKDEVYLYEPPNKVNPLTLEEYQTKLGNGSLNELGTLGFRHNMAKKGARK